MAWKLLDKRVVFDKFIRIEKRVYEMPDGQSKDFYVKLTRPAVCVLALTPDQNVITVRQYRPGPDMVLNELPGGYREKNEPPMEAAARELREETGYEGKMSFVTDCFDDAYADMKRACFVATDCKKISEQNLDSSEFIEVDLLTLPDFLSVVRAGKMTDVEVALLGLDRLGLLPG